MAVENQLYDTMSAVETEILGVASDSGEPSSSS
jgi:hypothetical protein